MDSPFAPSVRPRRAPAPTADWDENLADSLPEDERKEFGESVLELVEQDRDAREPWERLAAKGLKLMGIIPPDAETGGDVSPPIDTEGKAPDWWQSKVIHPLLG